MTTKEIIEKVCKDNNLTFRMLATATGLPEQYIYDINNGKIKKITAHKVGAFTKVFPQYPAMWLMTGNDDLLPSATNVSTGDNIHHNSGNVATHGAHITNITTIPPTTPAIPTTPPATSSATTPTTPAIPATDDDKDRLIAQLQSQIATLQAQIDAQHEHTDLLQALQAQIATLQSQIAELKADKQNLIQLLTNLTQNK